MPFLAVLRQGALSDEAGSVAEPIETQATESLETETPPEASNTSGNSEVQTQEAPLPKAKSERKTICLCKLGNEHLIGNLNNHDFAFVLPNMKIVLDGCGEGHHSEVGTRIFAQFFARKAKEYFDKGESIDEENFIQVVDSIFKKMLELCNDKNFIFNNYCFTILVCFETEDEFVVYSCGDGFIIKENGEGISFDKLDDGEYPAYFIYNYFTDKSALKMYKEGVCFNVSRFPKSEYSNVGVATDGLRFQEKLSGLEKAKLMQYLHEGRQGQIEKLINRNNKYGLFHDDISICF